MISVDSSMLNENGIMNLSNISNKEKKREYTSLSKGKTLGLTAQPFKKQPTNVNNKLRYIADIIFKRYAQQQKLKFEEFGQWLKMHKEFLESFRGWFRADLWKSFTHPETNQELLGFHKNKPDIEGSVKYQKFRSMFKKKAYLKMYDRFLMLFTNKTDIMPFRVIILKLIDINFNTPKNKIVITHDSKRYSNIKIIVPDTDVYHKWKKHLTKFTNNVLIKRYEWKEAQIIGKGKFSNVYQIKRKDDGKSFALKYIEKDELTAVEREAIVNEANILSVLHHQNIVRLYNTIETQKNYFHIFEMINGDDLYTYVTGKNFLDEYEASWIMKNLFDALECVHSRGIIHRDLKPENIMLEFKGDQITKLKLIDFGLSCFQQDRKAMETKCGTLNYTAPEILTGKEFDPRVDVFALGVIMYFMIRGSLPFYNDDQFIVAKKTVDGDYEMEEDSFFDNVSEGCKELIKGLLETDPEKRITLVDALAHDWIDKGETLKNIKNKNRTHFDLNKYL